MSSSKLSLLVVCTGDVSGLSVSISSIAAAGGTREIRGQRRWRQVNEALTMTTVISEHSPRARGSIAPHRAQNAVHGREAERRAVRDLLRGAQRAAGGVLLVEGETGIGKSLLLRDSVDEAAGRGFSLAAGAADQLSRAVPFFALRSALGEPFAAFIADRHDHDLPGASAWWISQMRAHLEQRAAATPVLVCLDDVQWASPATLAACGRCPQELKRHAVAWVLARSQRAAGGRSTCSGSWRRREPPGSAWPRSGRKRWRRCSRTRSARRRTRA